VVIAIGRRSIQRKAGTLWNQLPAELKEPSSVISFTQRLKIYLQTTASSKC